MLMTDPGSDFKSEVAGHLTRWFGMDHMFSLVDRHESCGVEGTGKQIARHVHVLTQEERIKDEWSSLTVLSLIEYLVNSHISSETIRGDGSQDAIYLTMADGLDRWERTHEFVRRIDENLQHLRAVSKQFQDKPVLERTSSTTSIRRVILFYSSETSQYRDQTSYLQIFPGRSNLSVRIRTI